MVPEIWSTTDIIFSHFGPIFVLLPPIIPDYWKNEKNLWRYHHFTLVYHKWQSYDILLLRYQVRQTNIFVILSHFLPFYPTNNPKNKILKKMKKKKMPGDIIILHKCTKNHDHMLYCSWDIMVHDRCNFYFSFGAIFCFLTPTPWKSKFLKNEKKPWKYHHFTHLYQKLWSIMINYGAQRMDGPMDQWME